MDVAQRLKDLVMNAPPPPMPPPLIFVPDSLAFIGFSIYAVLCAGTTLDTCDNETFDLHELEMSQIISLFAGAVAYGLAFLEIERFSVDGAWHVGIMAVALLAGLRHLSFKADLSRKSANAIMTFTLLPLLTIIFSKAEALQTTSCKLVSLISLTIAFLPVLIAFRYLKRPNCENGRAR